MSDESESGEQIIKLSDSSGEQSEHAVIVGDIIRIESDDPELVGDWWIEYVSADKIVIMKNEGDVGQTFTFKIEDGVIQDERIVSMSLLEKKEPTNVKTGYATHRGFVPETWVELMFEGLDEPIMGKITMLTNDSIEVVIFENGKLMEEDPMTLDFNYTGLPEGVLSIEIIKDPTDITPVSEPIVSSGSDIEGEDLNIQILRERDSGRFRHGIDEQTNDLLESMMSKLPPNKQVDRKVISNINKNITTYIQLRKLFSKFDENGNIKQYPDKTEAINKRSDNWKPLKQSLLNSNPSGWILPIVKNVKKIYNSDAEYDDVIPSDISVELTVINDATELYESGELSYIALNQTISPELMPFRPPNNMGNTFKVDVVLDTNVVVGNDGILSNVDASGITKLKPFQMNRYVSEITYMTQVKSNDTTKKTSFHTLLPRESMYVSSLLTLPNSFMRHSRLRLPGLDMVGRANMGTTCPIYSMALTSNTAPTTLSINNIHIQPNHAIDFASDHFKIYMYDNQEASINYDQFLEYFVPTTLQLISNKSQFSFTDLSISSVINKLEPYLIYTSDITLPQYNLINECVSQNSKVFLKTLMQYKRVFDGFKKMVNVKSNHFMGANLVSSINKVNQDGIDIIAKINYTIPAKFNITQNKSIINSELLLQMLALDCGKIFHTMCALSIVNLISRVDEDEKEEEPLPSDDTTPCIDYVVAKKYKTLEQLNADNGVSDLFFDRAYDTTDYSFLNDPKISKKKFSLSNDEFIQFLRTELLKKMADVEADQTIDALLAGQKRVRTGHYAILAEVGFEDKTLYKRVADEWEIAPNAPKRMLEDSTFLCNLQPDCYSSKNKCTPTKQMGINAENNVLTNRMNNKIGKSIEEHANALFDELTTHTLNVRDAPQTLEYKNNDIKYHLGIDVKLYDLVSPFAKYVDAIISYPDLERRYELIVAFCSSSRICRWAKTDESTHWMYCSTTHTKLIPSFFFQLATAYVDGQYEYRIVMAKVLKERKAVDENNITWIDKYSGYAIKTIEAGELEEYDESGVRMNNRAILEENEGERELRMLKESKGETIIDNPRDEYDKDGRYVYGIIDNLSTHMKIDIKNAYGFIIKTVLQIYTDGIMTEREYDIEYKKQEKKQEKQEKRKASVLYGKYLLDYLSNVTISVFLVVCQSQIPILNPRGTFAGCIKSFSGFPVGLDEDRSAMTYLFCILSKTKSVDISSKPRNLEPYIELVMRHPEIRNIVIRRQNHVEVVEVADHSIFKWTSFLPALIPFKLNTPLNTPESYVEGLIEDMNKGDFIQNEKILVLQSKIILFSYAIQNEIQTLMEKEPLILKTYENKQLNENACCNDSGQTTTLDYFKNNGNNNITLYNAAISIHRHTLQSVDTVTKSFMWLSSEKSGVQPIAVSSSDFSPSTVYAGFIKHCNFRTNAVNSQEISSICGEKLQSITISDTLEEIIDKLKREGTEYTEQQLIPLLKLVSKQVSYMELDSVDNSTISPTIALLHKLNEDNEGYGNDAILPKLLDFFTADETRINPAIEELRKYTFGVNSYILDKIKGYANKKSGFTERNIESFFINRSRTVVYFQFLKNSIINVGRIFPMMCITGTKKFREKLPNYWGITLLHSTMIDSMYNRIFEKVVRYYGKYALFFRHIINSSEKIIEIVSSVPYLENDNNEIGFLILEHYLLVVLEIYSTTDEHSLNSEDIYEEEVEERTTRQPRRSTINCVQEGIIRDFTLTLMDHNKHINVSYQDVVDATFRLKEKEKNALLEKLNNTADLEVDNLFKNIRIGERWGGGENVRGYDKERQDQELMGMRPTTGNNNPNNGDDDVGEDDAGGDYGGDGNGDDEE
jgi:hypothetical protein